MRSSTHHAPPLLGKDELPDTFWESNVVAEVSDSAVPPIKGRVEPRDPKPKGKQPQTVAVTDEGVSFLFAGNPIRTTHKGEMVAIAILKALGYKNPSASSQDLREQFPDLMASVASYSFGGRGRPPEVLSEKGVYKRAMVAGGPLAARFREWAVTQLQRIRRADVTLTAELLDRTENPDARLRITLITALISNPTGDLTPCSIQARNEQDQAIGRVHQTVHFKTAEQPTALCIRRGNGQYTREWVGTSHDQRQH